MDFGLEGNHSSSLARSGVAPEVNRACLFFNVTTLTPRPSLTGAGMMRPAASEECHEEVASATRRKPLGVDDGRQKETRLPRQDVIRDASTSELQKHPECEVLLACAAKRSQSRRSDIDEDTAAATPREK